MREYPTVYIVMGKKSSGEPVENHGVFYSELEAREWAFENLYSYKIQTWKVTR